MEELLTALYWNASNLARKNEQTAGEKNDYYITLEQLEALMKQVPRLASKQLNQ